MNNKQLAAMADARGEINGKGIQKAGRTWIADRPFSTSHDYRTIQSLVNRGYLQLYVGQTVAHITDVGIRALEATQELV